MADLPKKGDVVFVLRDYPQRYRFSHPTHFMLPVSQAMIDGLLELDDRSRTRPQDRTDDHNARCE
jgi:hypothetical protein